MEAFHVDKVVPFEREISQKVTDTAAHASDRNSLTGLRFKREQKPQMMVQAQNVFVQTQRTGAELNRLGDVPLNLSLA